MICKVRGSFFREEEEREEVERKGERVLGWVSVEILSFFSIK